MDNIVQDALDAIIKVINIHENHLYTRDLLRLNDAIKALKVLQEDGFK